MIRLCLMVYMPCFATHYAVEPTHRTDHEGSKLTQKAAESACAVIENDIAHPMGYLAYADASETCSHEVIDGRWLYLAAKLPHQRASYGVRG